MKWTFKAAAAAALCLVFGMGLLQLAPKAFSNETPIVEVNGYGITAAEFDLSLQRQRTSVIDYFQQAYRTTFSDSFWTTEVQGEVPLHVLKERALNESVRFRIVLDLAKEHGLIKRLTYADLKKELEQENKRRMAAIRKGEPVYGPETFHEADFLPYYISKLEIGLKEILAENELAAATEQFRLHDSESKSESLIPEQTIRYLEISLSYRDITSETATDIIKQTAKEQMVNIRNKLLQGLDGEAAITEANANTHKPFAIHYGEEQLDKVTVRTIFKSSPELYGWLTSEREEDSVSPLLDEAMLGEYVLVKVIHQDAIQESTDQEGQQAINALDQVYEAYVLSRVQEANVSIHEVQYAKISIQ
ncbi:MAG: hypothetical protein K6T85_01615 [Gorillibacterium sp.]|nr:hypothetical protein [Gorillibacterium sp.]